jgi:opacity protein-like surface antigen
MKKFFVMALVISMMAGAASAQKMYLRLGLGGGVGLKQYEGYTWSDRTQTTSTNDLVIKSMGLGGGMNINLAFGYMFSDNVGIEFGVNEFIGLPKKIEYTGTSSTDTYATEVKLSGKMLQIVPAIVITPGLDKVNPYARLGMIIGILPVVTDKYSSTDTYNPSLKVTHVEESKTKLYGGLALGFTAAAGAAFNLNEKLAFFGEVVFNGITYAPAKGKYTEWTEDGVDQLATATTKDKEWTFERKFDADETIPDGSPDKQPKMSLNFSNVALNVGIKFKL